MDYRQFVSGLYANAQANSGNNVIDNDYSMYMDPDVAKNKMKKSNINVNVVVPDTVVNDVNSQAQAQAQVQSMGGRCAPPRRVTIPIYKTEDVYKKAIQVREIEVKCGTQEVQVGEKIACVNDEGYEVDCEPTVTKDVQYVPIERSNVSHKIIGDKVPCRIDLPYEPKQTEECKDKTIGSTGPIFGGTFVGSNYSTPPTLCKKPVQPILPDQTLPIDPTPPGSGGRPQRPGHSGGQRPQRPGQSGGQRPGGYGPGRPYRPGQSGRPQRPDQTLPIDPTPPGSGGRPGGYGPGQSGRPQRPDQTLPIDPTPPGSGGRPGRPYRPGQSGRPGEHRPVHPILPLD